MPTQSLIQRAFVGGELAPALGARADQAKYLAGLRTCRNMIVLRGGGVTKRPGTKFVAEVKDSSKVTRLLSFLFEADDQTYLIEIGDLYLRFFWHGAPVVVSGVAAYAGGTTYAQGDLVVSGGVNYYSKVAGNVGHTPVSSPTQWYPLTGTIYEIPTPYAAADVARVRSTQSADVLTLTHPLYAPLELHRLGHTDWTLVPYTTAPEIDAPTGLAGVAGAAGVRSFTYVVTATKADTFEESSASAPFTVASAADPTVDAPNTLSWSAVTGAQEYNVYGDIYQNGVYGFLGVAQDVTFNDVGFVPDFTITPPIPKTLFAATGDYPSVACYHQQRLGFARSVHNPETVWLSQVGGYHNFSTSTPLQDDDAITFIIASNTLQVVTHLVDLKKLIVLTDTGEWTLLGDNTGALTPSAINADQEGTVGANQDVVPVVIGNSILYVQARGTVLRELAFDLQQGGFAGIDLTIFASHLFDGYALTDLAFAQQPRSVVWATRADGTLLGLTYVKDQEISAWHRHDTGASGVVEAVEVLPDTAAAEDLAYLLVKRTINGAQKRYIEQMQPRWIPTMPLSSAFYVDAGLTYSGAPTTTISGLGHLEGQVVAVLGDGAVVYGGDPAGASAAAFTVTGGSITLPASRSVVQVGIPIRFAEVETLDLDVQGTAIRDKRKRIQSLTALVESSAIGFLAGPDADHLIRAQPNPWDVPAGTISGPVEVNLTAGFSETGRVLIRHADPLPFTLLGLIPNGEIGG